MGANDKIDLKNYFSKLGSYFFSKSQGDAKVPPPCIRPCKWLCTQDYDLGKTLNHVDTLTI